MFPFIEDLCAINDHLEFYESYKAIYPSKVMLKKDSILTSEASFLDL